MMPWQRYRRIVSLTQARRSLVASSRVSATTPVHLLQDGRPEVVLRVPPVRRAASRA